MVAFSRTGNPPPHCLLLLPPGCLPCFSQSNWFSLFFWVGSYVHWIGSGILNYFSTLRGYNLWFSSCFIYIYFIAVLAYDFPTYNHCSTYSNDPCSFYSPPPPQMLQHDIFLRAPPSQLPLFPFLKLTWMEIILAQVSFSLFLHQLSLLPFLKCISFVKNTLIFLRYINLLHCFKWLARKI